MAAAAETTLTAAAAAGAKAAAALERKKKDLAKQPPPKLKEIVYLAKKSKAAVSDLGLARMWAEQARRKFHIYRQTQEV